MGSINNKHFSGLPVDAQELLGKELAMTQAAADRDRALARSQVRLHCAMCCCPCNSCSFIYGITRTCQGLCLVGRCSVQAHAALRMHANESLPNRRSMVQPKLLLS
jgi:hypothetical protein